MIPIGWTLAVNPYLETSACKANAATAPPGPFVPAAAIAVLFVVRTALEDPLCTTSCPGMPWAPPTVRSRPLVTPFLISA